MKQTFQLTKPLALPTLDPAVYKIILIFTDDNTQKWSKWRMSFEHQTGVVLKVCTGINKQGG